MRNLCGLWAVVVFGTLVGCTGGAGGDPEDDVGDILVLTHSPGNGDQINATDSNDGFNALNNPTLTNPGAVTVVFTNSLDPTSVLNPTPGDPQGTRNIRLFFFDINQGPFDTSLPRVPGSNPPGANVLIQATTVLTSTSLPNDTLILRPNGVSATNPLPEGQYSVTIELGVRGADGDGMKGAEYFFFFRVGQDNLGPVVVTTVPPAGALGVDPTSEIRVTMSETILASTVNNQTLTVSFQPAGATSAIAIPGTWFSDGGNGPGNNFPNVQLDHAGNPGFSGTSPRNGADLVFRPSIDALPVNMTIEDPFDPDCTNISDPPRKGNRGFPLGQAITVSFVFQGTGITDTASNVVPQGSPNTTFTFQTRALPDPVYAPNTGTAMYYGDTVGVGVIDMNPSRTPYFGGPNPARAPDTVATTNAGTVARVPIPDLVDMTTDTRPYTAFHNVHCIGFPDTPGAVRFFTPLVYAVSGSVGGGQVVAIDSFNMVPFGRFGTPSPGGVALTAIGNQGRLVVSNFSANTATVFDIGQVWWYTGGNLLQTIGAFNNAIANNSTNVVLTEEDFERFFPAQRQGVTSPPGPPIIGTINAGVSPSKVAVTGLNTSLGIFAPAIGCFSPILTNDPIICILNGGEATADFSHMTNLIQSQAIEPDLRGVNLASRGIDVAWATWSSNTSAYYFVISSVGGSVELFSTGQVANRPSVLPNSSNNFAPNKIINNVGGLLQPSDVQWLSNGNGVQLEPRATAYSGAFLVAETGANRLRQIGITAEFPSNTFQTINANHVAGLGPVSIAGDPGPGMGFAIPCTPRFTTYYAANAGEGTVRTASYQGGVIGTEIPVPGVLRVASWWSR